MTVRERHGGGIAITGGAGAIGRVLVGTLRAHGARDVRVVDPAPLASPAPGATHHAISIFARHALADAFAGCGAVIHLAAWADAGACEADPPGCFAINVGGTAAAIEAARVSGVGTFVLASTVYVYGESGTGLTETAPRNPQSVYAESKAKAEDVARAAAGDSLRVTIARLANVYGPGIPPTTVLATACEQAAAGGAIRLRSFAPQRDFVYVADVAEALARLATAPAAADVAIYNVGSGRAISVGDAAVLVQQIASECMPRPALEELEPAAASGTALVADVSALEARLGWRPSTPLADGLRATFRQWVSNLE